MVKPEMMSGSFQAILFTVITWNPESNCMCREKHHSLFHWNTSTWLGTSTSLDVLLEKNIDDYWNFGGDRELSDTWTGFTRFTILDEKPPEGYPWSGKRLTRKQTTSRPDTLWQEIWKDMSDAVKSKAKHKNVLKSLYWYVLSLSGPEHAIRSPHKWLPTILPCD